MWRHGPLYTQLKNNTKVSSGMIYLRYKFKDVIVWSTEDFSQKVNLPKGLWPHIFKRTELPVIQRVDWSRVQGLIADFPLLACAPEFISSNPKPHISENLYSSSLPLLLLECSSLWSLAWIIEAVASLLFLPLALSSSNQSTQCDLSKIHLWTYQSPP